MSSPREVVVLGSTGSVGTQALDVVRANPDRFRVVGLAAGGSDPGALAAQALDLGVEVVAVARASAAQDLLLAFYAEAKRRGFDAGEYTVPKILALQPPKHGVVAAVAVSGCAQGTEKLGADSGCAGEKALALQCGDKTACGAHRSDCMGAGRTDTDAEEIEDTDRHRSSLPRWR